MNRKKIFAVALACCLCVFFMGLAIADDTYLSVEEARGLIEANRDNAGFILLDVRAQEVFDQGHIPGARMINYYATNFTRLVSQLDRNATILIYCQRGRQSPLALRAMEKLRFAKMYILDGGFAAWAEAGLPVEPLR